MSTPRIRRVLETALYVTDMARAVAFYRDVLGLRPMGGSPRLTPMDAGEGTVLLLFLAGASVEGVAFPDGWIPPHDGVGPVHIAFAVDAAEFDAWHSRLTAQGLAIEAVNHWERGGRSLYFRDPDGHSLEFATPGLWPNH